MSAPVSYKTVEAAKILRTSQAMVRRMIRRGDIAAINVRGSYFVRAEAIEAYLTAHETQVAS